MPNHLNSLTAPHRPGLKSLPSEHVTPKIQGFSSSLALGELVILSSSFLGLTLGCCSKIPPLPHVCLLQGRRVLGG